MMKKYSKKKNQFRYAESKNPRVSKTNKGKLIRLPICTVCDNGGLSKQKKQVDY